MPLLGIIIRDIIFMTATPPPNVVFILTDDQDAKLGSMDFMPLVKKHIADKGVTFNRHYCTVSLCCPSRVSIWTGKAAHNHNVTTVDPPIGGFPKFLDQGLNDNYLPIWLQDAGYATYYVGKLFNAQTILNYRFPEYAKGWTGSEFLLDPFTYSFLNPWFARNNGIPKPYPNQYTTDIVGQKALGFLDEAARNVDEKPFFLAIAPVGPHADVEVKLTIGNITLGSNLVNESLIDQIKDIPSNVGIETTWSPPIPAARHAGLFSDAQVPRTPNFNPEQPSGADWVTQLPKLSAENITYNDEWYRQRLRSLQSIDELVEQVTNKLDSHGILDNTYIFYSTDNGFHIGQHRMPPGKGCPYEADLKIPLVVRGPRIVPGSSVDVPTSHTDLSPTFLDILGIQERPDFDGAPIPLKEGFATDATREHVQVEFWSNNDQTEYNDHNVYNDPTIVNNTYKSLRVIGEEYDLAYTVWCSGAHELYDMKTDEDQMVNLYNSNSSIGLLGVPGQQLINRLDGLLLALKTCAGDVCRDPWGAILPGSGVNSLSGALDEQYDTMFAELPRVSYSVCLDYYSLDAEQPTFASPA
ncbi:Arylsulphatase [Thozetella sp. PMI_491]|nr:Arylsulphatase [Thozetella sp. PMI_491]